MMLREIRYDETEKLRECMQALADHHNRVSVNFRGCYPVQPIQVNLQRFSRELQEGLCRITVIEEDGSVIGFCKADIHSDGSGKLDYLIILEAYRGRGFGKELMDWAMQTFEAAGVSRIEVKVVDGNDTLHFYEAYGFRMNAHILKLDPGPVRKD